MARPHCAQRYDAPGASVNSAHKGWRKFIGENRGRQDADEEILV